MWLFPNWVVKWVRYAKPHTAGWLQQPVEVFHVSPKMTKLEIKEYLRKLYNLPVIKVHTANYLGKKKVSRTGKQYKVRGGPRSRRSMPAPLTSRAPSTFSQEPDYKKAYVYLDDGSEEFHKLRYWRIEDQLRTESLEAWPAKPGEEPKPMTKKPR